MRFVIAPLFLRMTGVVLLGLCAGGPISAVAEGSSAEEQTAPVESQGPAPAAVPEPVDGTSAALEPQPPSLDTNQPAALDTITAEKAWRSFLQIQGQLDTALLAIERNRREGEAVSQVNQTKVQESLSSIEKVLQAQQEREIEALRESNRTMLIVAGAFAGVGFLAMFLTSLFHFRAMNRLTGIAATLPALQGGLGMGSALFSADEERMLETGQVRGRAAGERLLSAIERLERRVHELEHSTQAPASTDAQETATQEAQDGALTTLLGKGQALLNLGQAEQALQCFELALQTHPNDAETLVKKGTALEKLNRLDEAIACYDEAIAVNQSMTLAYLYKGGLFNRMERYNEALACYEQALKTQRPPASDAGKTVGAS